MNSIGKTVENESLTFRHRHVSAGLPLHAVHAVLIDGLLS